MSVEPSDPMQSDDPHVRIAAMNRVAERARIRRRFITNMIPLALAIGGAGSSLAIAEEQAAFALVAIPLAGLAVFRRIRRWNGDDSTTPLGSTTRLMDWMTSDGPRKD